MHVYMRRCACTVARPLAESACACTGMRACRYADNCYVSNWRLARMRVYTHDFEMCAIFCIYDPKVLWFTASIRKRIKCGS